MMSPTSRKLRKNCKYNADKKYALEESSERLSFTEEKPPGAGMAAVIGDHMNVVLGCCSTTKRTILEEHGWNFTVLDSTTIDMEVFVGKSTDSPLHVAKTVAHAMLPHFEDATQPVFLITTAQVLKVGDKVYHPPNDEAAAVELWQSISDQTVHFSTAVVGTLYPSGEQVSEIMDATATFKTISKEMAQRLVTRNYTPTTKNLPIRDVELKLRCCIDSGTEDAVLGMPTATCDAVLNSIIDIAEFLPDADAEPTPDHDIPLPIPLPPPPPT
jgi:predicted house-cleaning NTP pyrophosphatase (Maf/HAM1 superfamily)